VSTCVPDRQGDLSVEEELLVTTRLPIVAAGGLDAYGLVPLTGDRPCWRAVAVVCREADAAELVALVAVDERAGNRLVEGVTEELRASGCVSLRIGELRTPL
jgi:hypothetical protein